MNNNKKIFSFSAKNFEKIENQTVSFYEKNNDKIFNIIGKLSVIALIGYLIYLFVTNLSNLNGFNFDPFLILISVLGLIIIFYIQRQQLKMLKKINNKLANFEEKFIEIENDNIDIKKSVKTNNKK